MTSMGTERRTTSRTSSEEYKSAAVESSSTTTRVRAREEVILKTMRDCLGVEPTPYVIQEAAKYLQIFGGDERVLLYALHQTALAPRPSWRYTRAILQRCTLQGITGDQAELEDQLQASGLFGSYTKSGKCNLLPDLPM